MFVVEDLRWHEVVGERPSMFVCALGEVKEELGRVGALWAAGRYRVAANRGLNVPGRSRSPSAAGAVEEVWRGRYRAFGEGNLRQEALEHLLLGTAAV